MTHRHQTLRRRRAPLATLTATLFVVALLAAGCAGLRLRPVNKSVQRPSNVALYFAVETRGGQPVAGLDAKQFRIYEDDQLISPFESKQTILNPDVAVFFHACGVLILEGIGMTENTSFSNVNRPTNNRFGTVGPVGPGIEMKIAPDGETPNT